MADENKCKNPSCTCPPQPVASIAVLRVKARATRSSSIVIAGMRNAEAIFNHGFTRTSADY